MPVCGAVVCGSFGHRLPVPGYGQVEATPAGGADDLAALSRLHGGLYLAGKYGEAIVAARRARALARRRFGPGHREFAIALHNLALAMVAKGAYGEAEPLYRDALSIHTRVLGPSAKKIATTCRNLAVLYRAQGRDADAEPFFKRALVIYEAVPGARNPDTAATLDSLAELYRDQGRYIEAGPLYRRALVINDEALVANSGNATIAEHAVRARQARERQRCGQLPVFAAGLVGRGSLVGVPPQREQGLVDVAEIKAQLPLPETSDELCEVARKLGVAESEIRLGALATESEIKRLNRSRALARFRILHFATHGAVAGELEDGAEPGLILTPPAAASEADDGCLATSEIAQLALDADWAILSACNTAAGGGRDAQALSGLARAFFYAGVRALLVSHWAVDSDAAVKLITTTVDEMQRSPQIGRGETLRRAMKTLIDNGAPHEAHPAYWAPFVVVGEGGRSIGLARA